MNSFLNNKRMYVWLIAAAMFAGSLTACGSAAEQIGTEDVSSETTAVSVQTQPDESGEETQVTQKEASETTSQPVTDSKNDADDNKESLTDKQDPAPEHFAYRIISKFPEFDDDNEHKVDPDFFVNSINNSLYTPESDDLIKGNEISETLFNMYSDAAKLEWEDGKSYTVKLHKRSIAEICFEGFTDDDRFDNTCDYIVEYTYDSVTGAAAMKYDGYFGVNAEKESLSALIIPEDENTATGYIPEYGIIMKMSDTDTSDTAEDCFRNIVSNYSGMIAYNINSFLYQYGSTPEYLQTTETDGAKVYVLELTNKEYAELIRKEKESGEYSGEYPFILEGDSVRTYYEYESADDTAIVKCRNINQRYISENEYLYYDQGMELLEFSGEADSELISSFSTDTGDYKVTFDDDDQHDIEEYISQSGFDFNYMITDEVFGW